MKFIKPSKKGHVDVGRGEILFAAILKDFKFSDYGDLINSSGELLEIKPVNGKFRGSKNFDYNIRNLNFAEFFGSELAKNTDISDEAKGNLANYLQDFRLLSLTVCKETYNNFIETIDLFPNEAENLKKFFREFVRELLYTLLTDDVIKNHIIDYSVDQLTDDVFKDANTLRQTVYKILVAVNYTIYVTNEYEKKKLKYIIFCKDLDNDIQYIALNIGSDAKVLVNEFFKPNNIFEKLGIEFKLSLNKHSRGTTSFKMNSFLVEDMYDVCTDTFRELFTPFIEKSKYVTNYISTDSNTQIKTYIYVEKSLFIIKVTDLKNDNIDKQKIMYKLEVNGSTYKLATLDNEEDYNKSENFKNLKLFKNKDDLKQYLETELEKIKSNI